jgi:hypothetical protein
MSFLYQVVDIVLAGLIAGLSSFLLTFLTPDSQLAVTVGVVLASMYYFSRNPWGGGDAEALNAAIDDAYARVLPRR